MTVGPLRMRDVAVDIIPHGWEADAGRVKDVGLLGFDFLAELGVTIDYENQRVTVVPGDAFAPPADPRTIPLDVHIGDGVPRVTVAVNGAVGKHFVLDTGAGGSFLITAAFNRRHPEALKGQTLMGDPRRFVGIGGAFTVRPYKMHSLRLAKLNLLDWVGYQITSDAYDEEALDGLIGAEFLQLFTVHLDYGNSRVYLVPNKDGRDAMGLKA
jgi:Aspartyl protease